MKNNSGDKCPLCERKEIICPKCNSKLNRGKTVKETDGTEYTEFVCPQCKKRYADIKIPYSAMLQ